MYFAHLSRFRPARLSLWLLPFCLIAAGSCAYNNPGGVATSGYSQAPGSEAAVIIVGVRSLSQPDFSMWSTSWVRFDPSTYEFIQNVESPIVIRQDCRFGKVGVGECIENHIEPEYAALVVEPGSYVLFTVGYESGHLTLFATPEESLLADNNVKQQIEKGNLPWFTVKPGDVASIGEYVFDVDYEPARLVGIVNNQQKAEEILARLPNVTGEMVYLGP